MNPPAEGRISRDPLDKGSLAEVTGILDELKQDVHYLWMLVDSLGEIYEDRENVTRMNEAGAGGFFFLFTGVLSDTMVQRAAMLLGTGRQRQPLSLSLEVLAAHEEVIRLLNDGPQRELRDMRRVYGPFLREMQAFTGHKGLSLWAAGELPRGWLTKLRQLATEGGAVLNEVADAIGSGRLDLRRIAGAQREVRFLMTLVERASLWSELAHRSHSVDPSRLHDWLRGIPGADGLVARLDQHHPLLRLRGVTQEPTRGGGGSEGEPL